MHLTKTDFLEYLQCPKCLWLKKNRPDIYIAERISDFEESKIEEGHEVELLARSLFPSGTLVNNSVERSIVETAELLENKTSSIFQATFLAADHFLARVDMILYVPEAERWDIYEVKSSTEVKTDRAHNHIKDVAFQRAVLKMAGVRVGDVFIIHLNKEYRRVGDIDVHGLFEITNVSNEVALAMDNTIVEMEAALSLAQQSEVDLTTCSCLYLTRGNHCSSFPVFNPNVPAYSVHDISRISTEKIRSLIDSGVVNIFDVSNSFQLTAIQREQVNVAKLGSPRVNVKAIGQYLSKLAYPLYFLDYETYSAAIPILNGFGPYQHIPFQVSIDRLSEDGSVSHFEYLTTELTNAPCGLFEYMKSLNCAGGTIISWHSSFESTRNKEMAEMYPQYADLLLDLNARTCDLETPFKKDYLHPGFKGRTSIKVVLPVLVSKFSYKDLDIQGGTEAMESWRRLIFDNLGDSDKDNTKRALLDYCAMDTKAMVEIFRHLQAYVTSE